MVPEILGLHETLRCYDVLPDGTFVGYGIIAQDYPLNSWDCLYRGLRRNRIIPAAISFATFISWILGLSPDASLSVITTAAVNYLAADFLAASVNHMNAFQFHDTGTGTNPEAIGDTGLQTPTGMARVVAVGTNPSPNIYQSASSITYDGPYNITEWALMSALTGGTCWSRKVFAPIPVILGTIRTWTYALTIHS